MIIADMHEPEILKRVADKVEDLAFDYWILGKRCHYVLERKTFTDLINSLIGKNECKVKDRIFEQLERLKEFERSLRTL
ncbi:MAG: ERCC4 domain-containing protein [Archaeoglobaceae archaeon]